MLHVSCRCIDVEDFSATVEWRVNGERLRGKKSSLSESLHTISFEKKKKNIFSFQKNFFSRSFEWSESENSLSLRSIMTFQMMLYFFALSTLEIAKKSWLGLNDKHFFCQSRELYFKSVRIIRFQPNIS